MMNESLESKQPGKSIFFHCNPTMCAAFLNNFSFHHGEGSECVYFYCNRRYEDKQKGFLTWGGTRGITNTTWQAATAELGGTLSFGGAVSG